MMATRWVEKPTFIFPQQLPSESQSTFRGAGEISALQFVLGVSYCLERGIGGHHSGFMNVWRSSGWMPKCPWISVLLCILCRLRKTSQWRNLIVATFSVHVLFVCFQSIPQKNKFGPENRAENQELFFVPQLCLHHQFNTKSSLTLQSVSWCAMDMFCSSSPSVFLCLL